MRLDSEEAPYEDIAAAIEGVPGVLAHGLLLETVTEALVVGPDGPRTLKKVRVRGAGCFHHDGTLLELQRLSPPHPREHPAMQSERRMPWRVFHGASFQWVLASCPGLFGGVRFR